MYPTLAFGNVKSLVMLLTSKVNVLQKQLNPNVYYSTMSSPQPFLNFNLWSHGWEFELCLKIVLTFPLWRVSIFTLHPCYIAIAGSGANGAIIHYKPEPDSCSIVNRHELFLLDSGAQFVDGTTDITRTVHFGEPSSREKECFTRVLQVCFCHLYFFH